MYDRHLKAFIAVAELGSFARAGAALCLSPNAVIKQVNCLERDLGLALFRRSARGAELTPAGEVVYRGALKMIEDARAVVAEAHALAGGGPVKIRLAFSAMRPVDKISGWWREVAEAHPLITLETVPVIDVARATPSVYERVGKDIDVLLTIEPLAERLLHMRCEARRLFSSPACIAVPVGHRLAGRESVSFADLAGERLYLTARGVTAEADRLRDDLVRAEPQVILVDCPPYDVETFNRAAGEQALVLHCVGLGAAHPAYVSVALRERYDFPFCAVYAQDCEAPTREFVDAIAERAGCDEGTAVGE